MMLCWGRFIGKTGALTALAVALLFLGPCAGYAPNQQTSGDRLSDQLPCPCSATNHSGTISLYDLTWALDGDSVSDVQFYEHVQLFAAIQGLANRDMPQLFTNFTQSDAAWFPFVNQTWLSCCKVVTLSTVEDVVGAFNSSYDGLAVYDPSVYSTSLVASSLAGAFNLLPVAHRPSDPSSLYNLLHVTLDMPAKYNLTGMFNGSVTSSKKCDAYIWAIRELIESGACDASVHGYMIDYFWTTAASGKSRLANTIPNQDYVIANKGFFWDLDVWTDEPPNDDPTQQNGTDHNTLVAILEASNVQLSQQRQQRQQRQRRQRHQQRITTSSNSSEKERLHPALKSRKASPSRLIHVVGFVPWAFKYVNQHHQGVATEWEMVYLLSAYNAYVDADACCIDSMANAAFFQHLRLRQRYIQQPPLSLAQLQQHGYVTANSTVVNRMYISMYVGDYDSAAWLYNELKERWDDPNRGKVALGWAIDAELSWRFPVAFEYMYSRFTPNDRIISGDSGAGYLNPTQLLPPRVPSNYTSAASSWEQHNTPLFRQFDQRFTGFLINGNAGQTSPAAEAMYAGFSPLGVANEWSPSVPETRLNEQLPVFSQRDLPSDNNAAQHAQVIMSFYNASATEPQFFMWRNVLHTPSYYLQLEQALQGLAGDKVVIVDPHVQSILARKVLGGQVSYQATYLPDNLPRLFLSQRELHKLQAVGTSDDYKDMVHDGNGIPAGSVFSLNVTVRNDGWGVFEPSQWNVCADFPANLEREDSGNPPHAGDDDAGPTCTPLSRAVQPGSTASTAVPVKAPSTAGVHRITYYLQPTGSGASQEPLFGTPPVSVFVSISKP